MINKTAPSLLGAVDQRAIADTPIHAHSLLDLMYEGFYALFLLKNKCEPESEEAFTAKMQTFLNNFDRGAKKLDASASDIHAAKYAFCAAVDEIVLHSQFAIRDAWARRPLQLTLFGDQLAGENFFIRLEELRSRGSAHLQALEVYHMCLLLGFQGKYLIEGPEKLSYLTSRLGDEIAHMKGKGGGFAPHWERPDQIANKLRNDVPLWSICAVFALMGLCAYLGLNWMLSHATLDGISAYSDVIRMAPRAANITIIFP